MLNAILESKSGRLHRGEEEGLRWRDVFRESEDLVTSTVFERLSYLPGDITWSILGSASNGALEPYRLADIKAVTYWPIWPAEGRARGVEPDVFIEVEVGDPARRAHIIVEAKHRGAQTAKQLCGELDAWMESIASGELEQPDELVVVAIGGLPHHDAVGFVDDISSYAHERLRTLDVKFTLILLDWTDLARAVNLLEEHTDHVNRIINDISRALALFGYHHAVIPRQLEDLAPQLCRGALTLAALMTTIHDAHAAR